MMTNNMVTLWSKKVIARLEPDLDPDGVSLYRVRMLLDSRVPRSSSEVVARTLR